METHARKLRSTGVQLPESLNPTAAACASGLGVRHLTVDDVLYLHRDAMRLAGDSEALMFRGALKYCVDTARDVAQGSATRKALVSKAAYYIWCLVTNHPFLDGNKRTAFHVAVVFLRANGYTLTHLIESDVLSTLNGVATQGVSREELASWVEQHLSEFS